jgi:hypothetical protein
VSHLSADLEIVSVATRTLQQAHSEIAKAMQSACADLQSTKEVLVVVKKNLESESKQILRSQTKTRGNPDRGTRVPSVHSTHPAAALHDPCAIQQQATVMVLLDASAIARNVGSDTT